MKNAVIFHGTECKPEDFWYQWLKQELEQAGYEVDLPYYREINRLSITDFLPGVLSKLRLDTNTVLIGHSAGVP